MRPLGHSHGWCFLTWGARLESSPGQALLLPASTHRHRPCSPWPKTTPGCPHLHHSPAPQPGGIAAHLWHLSLQVTARKRKGEAELRHSSGFPTSGLHDEDDGLNLRTSLREGLFQPSLRIRVSCFPDWLLPSSQQLWTAQVTRSHACSAQASSETRFLCRRAGSKYLPRAGMHLVFPISALLLPAGDKRKV